MIASARSRAIQCCGGRGLARGRTFFAETGIFVRNRYTGPMGKLTGRFRLGSKIVDVMLAAAVGVVIVAALAAIAVQFPAARAGTAKTATEVGWQCRNCRHEWRVGLAQLVKLNAAGPQRALRLDCPACGAQRAGVPMVQCPRCKKLYVPHSMAASADGRPRSAGEICPHCKTDRIEWWKREHTRRW